MQNIHNAIQIVTSHSYPIAEMPSVSLLIPCRASQYKYKTNQNYYGDPLCLDVKHWLYTKYKTIHVLTGLLMATGSSHMLCANCISPVIYLSYRINITFYTNSFPLRVSPHRAVEFIAQTLTVLNAPWICVCIACGSLTSLSTIQI